MVSASRESVLGVQTSTARKNHRSGRTESNTGDRLVSHQVGLDSWGVRSSGVDPVQSPEQALSWLSNHCCDDGLPVDGGSLVIAADAALRVGDALEADGAAPAADVVLGTGDAVPDPATGPGEVVVQAGSPASAATGTRVRRASGVIVPPARTWRRLSDTPSRRAGQVAAE
ncbi:hypothetical protein ACIG87_09380 [Micromonospora sp. NPDC051925]|uniref:hypothetical protein n=1 Tax=Micromonospora sp. NPDC051925 TaxID=3364288 RepID=UPI0037CC4A4D